MRTSLSRRSFLATAATVSIMPRHIFAQQGRPGANGRVNVAGIGFGGMGASNLKQVKNAGHEIVALCDVDEAYTAKARKDYPDAPFYRNYRDLLDKQKDVDAVLIATPDHTHAQIAADAMRAGKHVFVQKPLCHDIGECRALAAIAKESGRVTQMGIQGHALPGHYLVREWLAAGAIGELQSIDAWCDLSYYPFGHASWSTLMPRRPTDTPAVPATLDWDLFIGPAPMRPYHPTYHPRLWRAWWDFGNGMMGDRGAHTLDVVFAALGERMPHAIDATSCGLNPDTHPLSAIITFDFPKTDKQKALRLTWYEGTRPPRPYELPDDQRLPAEGGVLFKGSEGKIVCGVYGESPRLLPEAAMQAFRRPAPSLKRPKGNIEANWLQAIIDGNDGCANFAYSARLTELTILGNIAKRADTRIFWDEAHARVTNITAANDWITLPRRPGWEL